MIKIDTDQMKQMVALVNSANNGIEEALDSLRQISSHGDWHCRERGTINENAERIRKTAVILRDSGTNLGTAIGSTLNQFVAKENEVINWTQAVEEIARSIISIKPKGTTIDGVPATGPSTTEAIGKSLEIIPVIDFQSLEM